MFSLQYEASRPEGSGHDGVKEEDYVECEMYNSTKAYHEELMVLFRSYKSRIDSYNSDETIMGKA